MTKIFYGDDHLSSDSEFWLAYLLFMVLFIIFIYTPLAHCTWHPNGIFFKMGIEHLTIKEISNCLSEAIRVLKPKGNLIVITSDWKWTYKFFYEEYTHQTPFTSSSLTTALKMAQFEVKYCQTLIQLPIIWKFPFLKFIADI